MDDIMKALRQGLHENPPAQQHSEPSKDAAEAIKAKCPTLRQRVYDCLVLFTESAMGGLTDAECQRILKIDPSTQRPRRIELVERGMVVDSGETRKTKSGRKATVWRST